MQSHTSFFEHFQNMSYYFQMASQTKQIIFRQQIFIIEVLLNFSLIFCQFQPGVACKSVANEQKRVLRLYFLMGIYCGFVIYTGQCSMKARKRDKFFFGKLMLSFTCPRFSFICKVCKYRNIPPLFIIGGKNICSENMQQIYRRTPTPKCDCNFIEITL